MGPQREDCCRRDGRALLCGEGLGARAPFWCRPRAERRHALRARAAAKGSAREVSASRAHTHGESLAPLPSCGGADTDAALSDTALSITRRTWTRLRGACRAARATAATLSRCRATADGRPRLHGIWCARGTSGWARWRMRCSERTLCAAPHSFSRPFTRHPRCQPKDQLAAGAAPTEPGTAPGAASQCRQLGLEPHPAAGQRALRLADRFAPHGRRHGAPR